MDTELTAKQVLADAKANASKNKAPRNSGKKKPVASSVHTDDLARSVLEAQIALRANDQAIIEKAIADQEASDRTLYLNARLAASKNSVAFFESVGYTNLSDRAAKKTANILQPVQSPQLQLAGVTASEEVPLYLSASDWLDQLDGEDDE